MLTFNHLSWFYLDPNILYVNTSTTRFSISNIILFVTSTTCYGLHGIVLISSNLYIGIILPPQRVPRRNFMGGSSY